MGSKHLTYTERLLIEKLYPEQSVRYIAELLGRHVTTIYDELKKGAYQHRNSDWSETRKYSARIGQDYHDYQQTAKGIFEKATIEMIETYRSVIVDGQRTVRAAAGEIKRAGKPCVSYTTLYRYVKNGYIDGVTLMDIKPSKRKYRKTAKRAPAGVSIEKRPEEINRRKTFGHWEMDCVIGRAKGKDETMLVLSERLTRFEIVWKMQTKHASSVVKSLKLITKKFGKIFKTITVDNGSEFADYHGIKRYTGEVYYCHPYTSCERGTNENINRMIRWRYPKGTSFKKITNKACQELADWINNYPRSIFGFGTAQEEFNKYVKDKVIIRDS